MKLHFIVLYRSESISVATLSIKANMCIGLSHNYFGFLRPNTLLFILLPNLLEAKSCLSFFVLSALYEWICLCFYPLLVNYFLLKDFYFILLVFFLFIVEGILETNRLLCKYYKEKKYFSFFIIVQVRISP